ncbi:MAG: DinB family protein [Pleurocapsa sp. SU_196_0]|nr:DinB family protein [Pleurocapsa sp. SU_196_0]
MEKDVVLNAILTAMTSAFDGKDGDDWFNGLTATLDGVTPELASRLPAPGRSSLAAHLRHVVYTLEVVNARFSGEPLEPDWDAAWQQPTVTAQEWTALRSGLEEQRRALAKQIETRTEPSQRFLEEAIKNLVHLGYHIGAMRQILLSVN